MFKELELIVNDRHNHAKQLKVRTNKGIIGYLCSYVPEEIIYAAGFIPVRLFSSEEAASLADTYMQSYYCTFSRCILHQALAGDFNYLDGLVTAYTCVNMRLAFDSIQLYGKIPFSRMIYTPGIIDDPNSKEFYYKELLRFKKDMENLSGRSINNDDLREAIKVYDENRSLVNDIFKDRRNPVPSITGKEAYIITLSGMLTDKQEHNEILKTTSKQITNRAGMKKGVNRLMIVGSPLDNLKLLDIIEDDLDAIVVTDDTCTCTRYILGKTPEENINQDPLKAIVERYLIKRPPCPTKHAQNRWLQCSSCPFRAVSCFLMNPAQKKKLPKSLIFSNPERICRFRHSLQLAINHNVEGVIVLQQKFCDPHGFDYHHVAQSFIDIGIPSIMLEIDNIISVGQIKTRVQAFLEMLQPVNYVIEPEIKEGISLNI